MPIITSNKLTNPFFKGLAALALVLVSTSQAFALPSFARQTGESCDSCHVGAIGPQLTPHGVKFKLGGYTDSDGKSGHIPLAAMLIHTYTKTSTDQDPAPEHFDANNNSAMQELSVFLAGKITDHVGAFAQATYSGVDKYSALDNTDVRYATETTLFGQEGTYGVSFNNNPTMQDPFNSLPAWRFPYTSSDLAPSPDAAPMLDDGVAGTVYGVTAYTMLKNGVYAELGAYRSFAEGFLNKVNVEPGQDIKGLAPYGRIAYYKDLHKQVYSVGLIGMTAKLRDYGASGASDQYTDIGVDGHYQYMGTRKHIISVDGSYISENRNLDALYTEGEVENASSNLHQFNLAGSYYFNNTYGATVRYFSTTGSSDTIAYESASPDSNGWTLQADWTPFGKEESWAAPWANLRLGLQYTLYNKLNGDSSNASDANTVMAFVWLAI